MSPVEDFCKTTEDGLAHLFFELDYGSICACGRKLFGFGSDEEPKLIDISSEWFPAVTAMACVRRRAKTLAARASIGPVRHDDAIRPVRAARRHVDVAALRDVLLRAAEARQRAASAVERARLVRGHAVRVRSKSTRRPQT